MSTVKKNYVSRKTRLKFLTQTNEINIFIFQIPKALIKHVKCIFFYTAIQKIPNIVDFFDR